jgi:hypothetical protein
MKKAYTGVQTRRKLPTRFFRLSLAKCGGFATRLAQIATEDPFFSACESFYKNFQGTT